jgi:hypothetical protein
VAPRFPAGRPLVLITAGTYVREPACPPDHRLGAGREHQLHRQGGRKLRQRESGLFPYRYLSSGSPSISFFMSRLAASMKRRWQ